MIALPVWVRLLLFALALPGLICMALSIAAFLVSLSGLLLLTVPAYRLFTRLMGTGSKPSLDTGTPATSPVSATPVGEVNPATGRRHIEVTIIE